jgi:hypothetical protein
MWIERIEIVGFGVAPKERIEFGKHAVNLFEEGTEQSKLLIPAVVRAAFFGTHQENGDQIDERLSVSNFKAPTESEAPFLVSIEFYISERKLRLTRNLNDDKIMILDRSKGDLDVTHEFVKDGGPEEAGELLTGVGRKRFEEICLLLPSGQAGHNAGNALSDFLKTITNGSSPILGEEQAVQLIDQSITQFPYKTINIKIDFLVDELEKQRDEVKKKIFGYLSRRSAIVPIIARLREIEPYVGTEENDRRAHEYFKCCLRAAEIDGQVMQYRSQQARLHGMKKELDRLGSLQDFTIESQRQIEELWTRRNSRLTDYHALADEVTPKIVQYEQQEMASKRKWESLHDFTPEQAQVFAQMTNNFRTMQQELDEFESQLAQRQEHLAQQPNVDLAKFERSRRTMQVLEPEDANDAKSYAALLTGFRNQAAESDRGQWRAEMLIKEIEEQRQTKTESSPIFKVFKPNTLRQKELEGATADLERHTAKLNDLKVKISGLEQRLAALAAKAGVADGAVLVQHINDYNAASSQLKELDILEQMIESRKSSIQRLRIDLEPYFKQSGRKVQTVTVDAASELAQELQSCMNDLARLEVGFEKAKISREQLEFLLSEVRNIEEILAQLFANAGLENPGDIEASYSEFYSKVASYHHWRVLEEEIGKTEEQYGLEGADDFSEKIAWLEQERRETWERIRYLVEHYPEIAEQLPPKGDQAADPGSSSKDYDSLLDERDQHDLEIRSFFSQFGNEYPTLADKLETLERELARTKANQLSLELAREKLNSLLAEDLSALETDSFQAFDSTGDPLPIIIDAGCLGQTELELAVAFKFLALVIAEKRQIILLSKSNKLDVSRLMQSALSGQQAVKFCLRTPAGADGSLQRA